MRSLAACSITRPRRHPPEWPERENQGGGGRELSTLRVDARQPLHTPASFTAPGVFIYFGFCRNSRRSCKEEEEEEELRGGRSNLNSGAHHLPPKTDERRENAVYGAAGTPGDIHAPHRVSECVAHTDSKCLTFFTSYHPCVRAAAQGGVQSGAESCAPLPIRTQLTSRMRADSLILMLIQL